MSECDSLNRVKKFLLVFNNEAGKGCSTGKQGQIIKYLDKHGCKYQIISADDLNFDINFNEYNAVVAVGGDGTVLKVIPYLANTTAKLGIIPCGTANLFAASLCIPFNIHRAVDILINDSSTKVDIGKAGNEYFALRIGMGFDADVVNNTKREWKKNFGYLAYFFQGLINCFKLTRKSYKITIDDKTMEVNANSIIIANAGNMFRNFFTIAPQGSVNDGKLDVFILLAKNFWEFISIFMQILSRSKKFSSNVIYGQATNIKIETNNKNIHIDGEPYYNSTLDISIIPEALMVVVP